MENITYDKTHDKKYFSKKYNWLKIEIIINLNITESHACMI